jgi:PAS domain-containing protein
MSTNHTPGRGAEQRTDARIAEAGDLESLRISEIRYRRLFESAQDGILILDAETGMVTDMNPYLLNLLGYSHAEVLC